MWSRGAEKGELQAVARGKTETDAASMLATCPLVNVGDEINLAFRQGGPTETAVVVKATARASAHNRGSWVYTLRLADGTRRKTRLSHLSWSLVTETPGRKHQRKRSKTAKTKRGARNGDDAAPSSTKAKKTKTCRSSEYLRLLQSGHGTKIVAPMVGGSELAFRLLCRKYSADVAYTPMMNADEFAKDAVYRRKWLQSTDRDWPLVAHFCGNDPSIFGQACRLAVEECPQVDAVDCNLGCPQRVAYSGHFGSYLLGDEDRPLVRQIVQAMRQSVPSRIAVCVKIRLLDTDEDTLKLVTDLREAGADIVAIHGRKRATWHKRGPGARDGPADLDAIKKVVEAVGNTVCVVTNGNVRDGTDAQRALESTSAHGVMSAEGLLNNPKLFMSLRDDRKPPSFQSQLDLAREYLDLVAMHGNPAGYRSIAFHTRRICNQALEAYNSLDDLLDGTKLEDALAIVDRCRDYASGRAVFHPDPEAKKRAADRKNRREDVKRARRRFEERMARKAKREGKPLDAYLKIGAEPPTQEQLKAFRAMGNDNVRLNHWKRDFSQVCFSFALHPGGCARGETCAFLHAVQKSQDDDDFVSG